MQVLLVDLGQRTHPNLAVALRAHGHAVETVDSVAEAVWVCHESTPAVALVCVDTAGDQDVELAGRLREAGAWTPLIVVAREASTEGVVAALDAGADDVVSAPARLVEVCARVRANGRRDHAPRPPVLAAGGVRCDLATGEVTRDGVAVDLSPQQQAVLVELLRRPGHVLTRLELLESAWDPATDPSSNVVDQAIAALRRRIDTPFGREDLETVRGRGYRWRPS